MVSSSDISKLFDYESGSLIRKSSGSRGYKRPDGYVYTRVNGKSYGEHRLVFLMFNGFMPDQVDHINGIRDDNRTENLRAATHAENCMNRKQVGRYAKGCYWQEKRNKWIAQIGYRGKRITIGYFESLDEAEDAYKRKSIELHGEFSRLK